MTEPGDRFGAPPPAPPPPGPPSPPATPESRGNPWERRSELGFGAGLIEAVKLFVTSPGAAYQQTRKRGDFLSPLLFGIIIGWFGAIIGQIWQFVFQGSLMSMFPMEMRDQMAAFFVTTPVSLAVSMILTPIFLTIGLFLWSAIHHVSLLLVGALGESDAGFEGTFRVNGYGNVVQLAAIVPLIGSFLLIVWYVVMMTIGASRIHQTTPGRALAGALLPLIVCCLCGIGFFVLGWAMIAGALTQMQG